MRAALSRLVAWLHKSDSGFLASRFALFVPIIVFSHALDDGAFARFSSAYHAFLFAGNLAIWGAHDALLVNPSDRQGRVTQLLFLYVLASVGTGAVAYLGGWFGLSIGLFVLVYRPVMLLALSVRRDDRTAYIRLVVGLVMSTGALVLPVPPTSRLLLATLCICVTLAPMAMAEPTLLSLNPRLFRQRASTDTPFALNHILSGFFIQGSLYVYAFWAQSSDFVVATQFAYLLNGVLVFQGLVYRIAVHRFADDRPAREDARALLSFAGLTLGIAASAAVTLATFGGTIESLLFGRVGATSTMLTPLVTILLVHSLNYPLAGLLVGSGQVRSQLVAAVGSAITLVIALLAFSQVLSTAAYGWALLVATLVGLAGRTLALTVVSTIPDANRKAPRHE